MAGKKEKLDLKLLKLNLKRTWKYLKSEKRNIIIYAFLTIIQIIIGIALPLISARVILNITNGAFEQLLLTGFIVLVINSVDFVISYFCNYCTEHITKFSSNKIQADFTREFLKLQIKEIDKSSTGAFMERVNYDTSSLTYVFLRLSSIMSNTLSKLGTLVTIFLLNKYVFSYYIIVALINLLIGEHANRIREDYWKKTRTLNEEKTSFIGEVMRGIRDIKVLNADERVAKKATDKMITVTMESFSADRKYSLFNIFKCFVMDLSEYIFLALGIFLCYKDLLNIPTFLILYNYRGGLSFLFNNITDLTSALREFNLSAKRVYEVIFSEGFEKETFGDKKLKKVKGHLEFKNVSFSYDGEKQVLNNINFEIMPNEQIAFVGKSGSGKSTIFNLITKLYTVNDGSILLDNININDLDKSSLRDNMSIITQNPYIFNFSIRENLLLANPKASMQDIRKACKLACIDEYIMSLEEKYDTKLGEGGLILSGGQKQRLAIARALLMKTEFILFDEATSALDNETQSEIQDAINNLKGEYTILIIAHRLSTIIDSDKIFVVDKGKIVGEGSHRQLLKSCDFYKHLYEKDLFTKAKPVVRKNK